MVYKRLDSAMRNNAQSITHGRPVTCPWGPRCLLWGASDRVDGDRSGREPPRSGEALPWEGGDRLALLVDWPTLRAYGALWKADDAECYPTGGSYIAQLRLDGSRLSLRSVRYSRHDLPFP
jgi:hypothetical protein